MEAAQLKLTMDETSAQVLLVLRGAFEDTIAGPFTLRAAPSGRRGELGRAGGEPTPREPSRRLGHNSPVDAALP
jgi:hypothetical protein